VDGGVSGVAGAALTAYNGTKKIAMPTKINNVKPFFNINLHPSF
jgi:hypothetical protein